MAKSKRRNSKKPVAKEEEKVEVNYAETADSFATDEQVEEDEDERENDMDDSSEEGNEDANSSENESDEDVEEEEEEDDDDDDDDDDDVEALFKGASAVNDDGDENSESDGDDEGEEAKRNEPPKVTAKSGPEQCNFDLKNLTAMNSHQIPVSSLYSKKKARGEESISIPLDQGHELQVNEEFLLDRASSGCAQLISAIWQLPVEASDAGPLVTLPGYDEITIPRAMVSVTSATQ